MKDVWLGTASLAIAVMFGTTCSGQSMRCAGVLGNSGAWGPDLVRMSPAAEELARPTGLYVDADLTVWMGAGAAIVRLSLDGRQLERRALEPDGCRVEGFHFAAIGQTLYFPGRTSGGRAVFALRMAQRGEPARPIVCAQLDGLSNFVMAAEPLENQRLLLADAHDGWITVRALDPTEGVAVEQFRVRGHEVTGIAWDAARERLYVGGRLRGEALESGILVCDLAGKPAGAEFPAATTPTPAQPTAFRGRVSLAGESIWDVGHYGYLARLDLHARGAPGIVSRWAHALDEVTQVAALGGDSSRVPLLLATSAGDACWLAQWTVPEQTLLLRRRLGALPTISNLGLSHDGWITVGTAQSQYWWRWEDAADSPPRMADLSVASTPGVFIDHKYCALGAVYGVGELARSAPVPLVFEPRRYDRNSAQRPGDAQSVPVREPVGLAVLPGPCPALIVSDVSTRQLWTARLDLPAFLPVTESWQPMPLSGAVLTQPTDVAVLEDHSLLVADAGRVWHVRRDGDAWHACGHYDGPPDEQLGSPLHLAVDGPWVLVSDCERHRVLWLEQTGWTLLGQWGTCDRPGPGLDELSHPTFVTIAGRRAVVADAGNQRLVLLELEEESGSQRKLGGSVRLGHQMHDPIRQQHLRDRL